ncbi:MAG: DUF721 domain-containing protein [Acidobacteria bacterium]|nr:DUF721 domain-containing protein [Acidobacteriota bacterium]MBI3264332.1 DUF721 domain-containing protein [Acidobacteriota bacterium]
MASSALGSLLKAGPLSPGKLQFAWRLSVGPAIDRVSRVALGPDGSVVVMVSDPRWKKEIGRSRETIRQRLAELLGKDAVKRITVSGG